MASSNRTTIVLGQGERRAAKRLAAYWGITASAAIRRALLEVEREALEAGGERRRRTRMNNLRGLFEAFSTPASKVSAELKRVAEERDAW